MDIATYKANTLARTDVDDIVRVEPVEVRPIKDATGKVTGYEQVVQTTENGRTITKYDVHLMRVENGIKVFDKEHIAVVDEGKATEEVVFTAPSTEKLARTASKLEKYINGLPYLNVEDIQIDPVAKNAEFKALKDNGDGTATEVRVYAYIKVIPNQPNQTLHVEVTN